MVEQLQTLSQKLPGIHWTLTTSRRTPASFMASAAHQKGPQFSLVPVEQTNRLWLRQRYRHCGIIWVTEDSASMVYEALTAGAQVGVLPAPRQRPSRVSQGLDTLVNQHRVTSLASLCETGAMNPGERSLDEAGRVADHLLSRLNFATGQSHIS